MEHCHWSEGYVGVSLQDRRATMQVMLGVSLRARWDATLVHLIIFILSCLDLIYVSTNVNFTFSNCMNVKLYFQLVDIYLIYIVFCRIFL